MTCLIPQADFSSFTGHKPLSSDDVHRIDDAVKNSDGSIDIAQAAGIAVSGLFDVDYYYTMHPDINKKHIDPIQHYVLYGASEGRNPAKWFDTILYCEENPELLRNRINPFLHYLLFGYKEHRRPNSVMPIFFEVPKISVIVPVYNNAEYIEECIESITNQTLKSIEILCINDGSTDPRTPQILDSYAVKDARVRVIHKPNAGTGHTWNVGMRKACGKYIAFVDADDYILPRRFEKMYSFANAYNCDIVKCDFKNFFGSGDKKVFMRRYLNEDVNVYDTIINFSTNPNILADTSMWSGIYKNYFIFKNNIWFRETPGASYQDIGFTMKTLSSAQKIYYFDDPSYMWRRDNAESSMNSMEKVHFIIEEFNEIFNFVKNNNTNNMLLEKILLLQRHFHYMYCYNRIAAQFKLDFLKMYSDQLKAELQKQILDRTIFKEKWNEVYAILNDYEAFYLTTSKLHNEPLRYNNMLVTQLREQGQLEQAVQVAASVLENYPESGWANFQLSLIAHTRYEFENSLLYANRAIASQPDAFHYKDHLANILMRKRDYDAVIALAHKALSKNPLQGWAFRQLSRVQLARWKRQEAVAYARKAVEVEPGNLNFRDHLSNVLRQLGDIPASKSIAEGSLTINPCWAEAYRQISYAHDVGGDLTQAIDCARKAIEVQPRNLWFNDHLMNLLRKTKRWEEVENGAKKIIREIPYKGWPYRQLSCVHEGLGNLESSEEFARKAVDLEPYTFDFRAQLSNVLRKQRNFAGTLQLIQESLDIYTQWGEGYRQLSFVYEAQGDLPSAIEFAHKSCDAQPEALWFNIHLCNLLRKSGDAASARKIAQHVLGIDSKQDWAVPQLQIGN